MVWIYRAFFEPGTGGNKRETEHEQGLLLLRRALREQYGIDCGDGRKPDPSKSFIFLSKNKKKPYSFVRLLFY